MNIFLASCVLLSLFNPDNWTELSKVHVTKNAPTQEERVLWMNTYSQELYPVAVNYPYPGDWSAEDRWMERYGWAGKSYPDNKWITISVADRVPDTCKAIYLTGILIITTGNAQEDSFMKTYFRRKGDKKEFVDIHRASVSTPCGVRTPVSLWVSLNEDKEFEFKWTRSTYGQYPNHSAYGMALYLNAWGE